MDDFVRERAEALETLHDMHARGDVRTEDMVSFSSVEASSLADVVLHRRIPPVMIPALYGLRNEVPDDLGSLADTDRNMESKIGTIRGLGDVLGGIFTGLAGHDYAKYAAGEDGRLNYVEDCGRFLLEGKLSAEEESAIRHAVTAELPGSNLQELCEGVAVMRGAMYNAGRNESDWDAGREALERMGDATVALLGRDALPPAGEYTRLLHKSRDFVVTQALAFSAARAWRRSPSSLALLFIDRISLPAGRMMRPAR